MTIIERETCTMLYVNSAYFTAADLESLYYATPKDEHGWIVHVDEEEPTFLSPGAQAITRLAQKHAIAWLRLDPDVPAFDDIPLLTAEPLPHPATLHTADSAQQSAEKNPHADNDACSHPP